MTLTATRHAALPSPGPSPAAAERKPSIRRIAEEVGLSVATVSRVLNNTGRASEKTRERVLEAARQAGYAPRVGMRATNFIGLMYVDEDPPRDFGGFESRVIAGMLESCTGRGFNLAILSSAKERHPSESHMHFLRRKGVSAVALRGSDPEAVAEELAGEDFPSIIIAGRSPNPGVNFVDAYSRTTSRRAVEHLLELGHRKIAIGVRRDPDTDHTDRLEGYKDALQTAGIGFTKNLVFEIGRDQASGAEVIDTLLTRRVAPTAIYFTTPLATVGALHRCADRGINVPRDLSIVGFDEGDTRLGTFPRFTAVCQDARRLAAEATTWLIDRALDRGPSRLRVTFETSLAVLESTAPPAAGDAD